MTAGLGVTTKPDFNRDWNAVYHWHNMTDEENMAFATLSPERCAAQVAINSYTGDSLQFEEVLLFGCYPKGKIVFDISM